MEVDYAPSDIDQRLIERFARGEQAAFDALVARHRRTIFHLLRHLIGDHHTAEELTLEVFLQAYLSLPTFQQQAAFTTWLHRIAVNVALQYLRQPHVQQAAAEVPLREEDEEPSPVNIAELVVGKETAARVALAMQELPYDQRVAVALFHLQGFGFAEIARMMGIPLNTVKSHVFRGTKQLREKLEILGIVPASRRGTR